MGTHFLGRLFNPKAIAVFGASKRPESVGNRVFDNLRQAGFSGTLYAINPKYKRLYHQPCYPSITAIDKPVDLAVIATPAKTVAEIIHACGEHGVRAVIIISVSYGVDKSSRATSSDCGHP